MALPHIITREKEIDELLSTLGGTPITLSRTVTTPIEVIDVLNPVKTRLYPLQDIVVPTSISNTVADGFHMVIIPSEFSYANEIEFTKNVNGSNTIDMTFSSIKPTGVFIEHKTIALYGGLRGELPIFSNLRGTNSTLIDEGQLLARCLIIPTA